MRNRRWLLTAALAVATCFVVVQPVLPQGHNVYLPSVHRPPDLTVDIEWVGHIGGKAQSVALQGDYAYLALGPSLVILDVSDPANPVFVAQTALRHWLVGCVAVSGDYAYLSSYGAVEIIDVSDPQHPVQVGIYGVCSDYYCYANISGIAADGNYVYIVSTHGWRMHTWNGLHIIDVSDPANPVRMGSVGSYCGLHSAVAVRGGYAYVASGRGLQVIDVSNPARPSTSGFCDLPVSGRDVAIGADGHVYIAGERGLHVIDVSDPANPHVTAYYETPGNAHGVVVDGTYAYVANDWGMSVFDVSDPSNPVESGAYHMRSYGQDVAAAAGYAYVAELGNLRIIDVSDPEHPSETGAYCTPGNAYGVAVAGEHVYVADVWAGLHGGDISDPPNPRELGV